MGDVWPVASRLLQTASYGGTAAACRHAAHKPSNTQAGELVTSSKGCIAMTDPLDIGAMVSVEILVVLVD